MLTQEQIDEKVKELEQREGVKVYPIIIEIDSEQIVGYVREPKRQAKFAAIDKFWAGETTSACGLILSAGIIEDASDKRMISQLPEHDDIVISASMACLPIVKIYTNSVKKN